MRKRRGAVKVCRAPSGHSPYRVRLSFPLVECTDVLQKTLLDAHRFFYSLNDGSTEVQCEVGAYIVASCVPTLRTVILVRFLVFDQGLNRDGTDIVVGVRFGPVYRAG